VTDAFRQDGLGDAANSPEGPSELALSQVSRSPSDFMVISTLVGPIHARFQVPAWFSPKRGVATFGIGGGRPVRATPLVRSGRRVCEHRVRNATA
jgi:hypothetical protein